MNRAQKPPDTASGSVGNFRRIRGPCSSYLRATTSEIHGFFDPNDVSKPAPLGNLLGLLPSMAGTVRIQRDMAALEPTVAPKRTGSLRHGPVR
ncbi:UNVERIFIED_CONTAM: hypothetical protein ABIE34_001638 [Jeotgalibacillus campisalis]